MYNAKEENLPRRERSPVFFLETLKNCILNEKFNPEMITIRAFLPKMRALFSNFWKRAGEISSSSPSSYAPGHTPPFLRFPPFWKFKMSPTFIGLSGKEKYWIYFNRIFHKFYSQSILIFEKYLIKWWNAN